MAVFPQAQGVQKLRYPAPGAGAVAVEVGAGGDIHVLINATIGGLGGGMTGTRGTMCMMMMQQRIISNRRW